MQQKKASPDTTRSSQTRSKSKKSTTSGKPETVKKTPAKKREKETSGQKADQINKKTAHKEASPPATEQTTVRKGKTAASVKTKTVKKTKTPAAATASKVNRPSAAGKKSASAEKKQSTGAGKKGVKNEPTTLSSDKKSSPQKKTATTTVKRPVRTSRPESVQSFTPVARQRKVKLEPIPQFTLNTRQTPAVIDIVSVNENSSEYSTLRAIEAQTRIPQNIGAVTPPQRTIPQHYNITFIKAMPQDPHTLFVFWEIDEATALRQCTDLSAVAPQTISVHLTTSQCIRVSATQTNTSVDIAVQPAQKNLYIYDLSANSSYTVAIGYFINGQFQTIAATPLITMPNDTMLAPSPEAVFYNTRESQTIASTESVIRQQAPTPDMHEALSNADRRLKEEQSVSISDISIEIETQQYTFTGSSENYAIPIRTQIIRQPQISQPVPVLHQREELQRVPPVIESLFVGASENNFSRNIESFIPPELVVFIGASEQLTR